MRSAVAVVIAAAAILSGCSGKPGEKFIGKWQGKDRPDTLMEIKRNGDGFVMDMTTTKPNGQKNTGSVPATIKDGVLNYPNGPVTGTVTHVEDKDELFLSTFAGNFQFVRAK